MIRTSFCYRPLSGLPMVVEIALDLLLTTRCATQRSVLALMRTSVLSSAFRGATNTTITSSTPGYHTSTQMVSNNWTDDIYRNSYLHAYWRQVGVICPLCPTDVFIRFLRCLAEPRLCVCLCACVCFQRPASVNWAVSQRKQERLCLWTRWCTMGPAAATQTPLLCVPGENVWYVFSKSVWTLSFVIHVFFTTRKKYLLY